MKLIGLIVAITFWVTAAFSQQTKNCLTTPYDPSQYTCQEGALCPIVGGEPSLRCGRACYLKEAYACKNGLLVKHQEIQNTYVLEVRNSIAAINGRPIVACGEVLNVAGSGSTPCAYCPYNNCADMTNTTILAQNGDLFVEVPGGQQSYTNKDGSIGYTEAHSISMPPGAQVGALEAYQHGYFVNKLGRGWMACPHKYKEYTGYDLFAKLDGLKFAPDCVSLNLVTKAAPAGKYGTWQWL